MPLQRFLDGEMKNIMRERKVLENKRLDLDACKNKVRKARSMQDQQVVSVTTVQVYSVTTMLVYSIILVFISTLLLVADGHRRVHVTHEVHHIVHKPRKVTIL